MHGNGNAQIFPCQDKQQYTPLENSLPTTRLTVFTMTASSGWQLRKKKPQQHNAVLKSTERLKSASGPTVCLNKQEKLRADSSRRAGRQQHSKQTERHSHRGTTTEQKQAITIQRCLLDCSVHELA